MAFPIIFAQLAAGVQPLSDFDTMFGVVGNMGAIYCTATGSNTIALTPISNMPTVASYTNYQAFGFVATAASTGSVTVNVSGVGALPVYQGDGATQLTSGDITSGSYNLLAYVSSLNSGGGGFQRINFTSTTNSSIPPRGLFTQLKGVWASNTTATWTANSITLWDNSGNYYLLSSFSETIDTSKTGAGGLDTGTLAASTWYYVYALRGASGTSIVFSTSTSAPTLPSGYSYFARIGTFRSDGSKNIVGFIQYGSDTQYVLGNNISNYYTIASGSSSTTGFSVANYVPTTASRIFMTFGNTTNSSSGSKAVGPNSNAVGTGSPYGANAFAATTIADALLSNMSMVLESSSVYYNSGSSAALLLCTGYEDNF